MASLEQLRRRILVEKRRVNVNGNYFDNNRITRDETEIIIGRGTEVRTEKVR